VKATVSRQFTDKKVLLSVLQTIVQFGIGHEDLTTALNLHMAELDLETQEKMETRLQTAMHTVDQLLTRMIDDKSVVGEPIKALALELADLNLLDGLKTRQQLLWQTEHGQGLNAVLIAYHLVKMFRPSMKPGETLILVKWTADTKEESELDERESEAGAKPQLFDFDEREQKGYYVSSRYTTGKDDQLEDGITLEQCRNGVQDLLESER